MVEYPGAASGDYGFKIGGASGSVNCAPADCFITAILEVTDYNPKQGSTLGGTLVTITGQHFGDEATDNPVKIGDNYCYVQETSEFEIKCRIGDLDSQAAQTDALVLVFARTTEEMQCNRSDSVADCFFEYVAPPATVTSISSAFDTVTNSIVATVTGSSLGTDVASTELVIDGNSQTTLTASDSSATFQIINLLDLSSSDIKFYNSDGTPNGASSISSHTFVPGLVSIEPSTGSAGGAKLTITGVGFGVDSTVNLYHQESNQDLCYDTEVTAYGTFVCYTIAQEI